MSFRCKAVVSALVIVLLHSCAPAALAQFPELDDLSGRLAKKFKKAKPHMVAVADFTAPDGSLSPQGDYFSSLLSNLIAYHEKKVPVAQHASFEALLAKEKIASADLLSRSALQTLAAHLRLDYVVTGTIQINAKNYTLHLSVRRIPDASEFLSDTIVINRSEFTDSLTAPFPPETDYPVIRFPSPPSESDLSRMPHCIFCPDPSYSDAGRAKKIQGKCVFEILLSGRGEVVAIHPLKLLGYDLDEQAFNTIKRWQLRPATDSQGNPVAVIVPVEVTFRLF